MGAKRKAARGIRVLASENVVMRVPVKLNPSGMMLDVDLVLSPKDADGLIATLTKAAAAARRNAARAERRR